MEAIEHEINQGLCSILRKLWSVSQDEENGEIKPYTIDGTPVRKLFVANLAQRTTHKDLEKLFTKYGKLDACYLKRNKGRNNFAFVTFNQVDDALKAIKDGQKKRIHLHHRDLRVLAADSWHQPDSIENQKKKKKHPEEASTSQSECGSNEFILNEDSLVHQLNDDCLMHIFSYLPITDRIRIERVCKRWQSLSLASWRTFKILDLEAQTWGFKNALSEVNTPSLRRVLLRCGIYLNTLKFSSSHHKLSKSTLTVVGRLCPNLNKINMEGLHVSPSGIKALTDNCLNIMEFTLGRCSSACDNDLSHLFLKNKKLRYVKIVTNMISGKCLLNLPAESIDTIILEDCAYMTSNYILSSLPRLTKLHTLKINSCVTFDELTASAIGACINLKVLHMCQYFPMMRIMGMKFIADLINLEVINMSKNILVNDEFLKTVGSKCKNLKEIYLNDCSNVTDSGLASVTTLPKLESLYVNRISSITDIALSDMPNIKNLECRECLNVGNEGLTHLLEMSHNIEHLDVTGCEKVTNRLVEMAIKVTKTRTNNKILKLYVGRTSVILSEIEDVSPYLLLFEYDLSNSNNFMTFDQAYHLEDLIFDDDSNDYDFESEEDEIFIDTDDEDLFFF